MKTVFGNRIQLKITCACTGSLATLNAGLVTIELQKVMPITMQKKPLTGTDLLAQVQEMGNANKKEKAKACGYVTQTKNGQERVNLMQFYNAMLAAKDVDLDATEQVGTRGRAPTYRVSVHKNGNLLIGATYTKEMGLKPGDEFEIKLGHRNIKLDRLDIE